MASIRLNPGRSLRKLALAGLVGVVAALAPLTASREVRGEPPAGGTRGLGGEPPSPLEVWSFNLRYASSRGSNTWEERRPVTRELLEAQAPDIIGTQEGLYAQLRDLDADLPGHDWIGTGREGGSRGEFMAIFYRRDRFEPLAFDHLWLSETPRQVGSKSWGNQVVRMVTWVKLRDRRSDARFIVLNTHFDHESEASRVRSARLVADLVGTFDRALPIIITGDFNTPAGTSESFRILTEDGVRDTWEAASERSPEVATFHGYRPPVEGGPRIDWILTRGVAVVEEARIHTFARDGQLPSDHYPVSARLRLRASP